MPRACAVCSGDSRSSFAAAAAPKTPHVADMPAPRIVLRRDRIADAALDFHPEHKSQQYVRTGGAMTFRQGQDWRRHGRGRMDHRGEMRVVVIEQVGTDRIEGRGTE